MRCAGADDGRCVRSSRRANFPAGRNGSRPIGERIGRITGATADAIIAVFLQREPALPPRSAAELNRWQAFATLWRQQWQPPEDEERRVRTGRHRHHPARTHRAAGGAVVARVRAFHRRACAGGRRGGAGRIHRAGHAAGAGRRPTQRHADTAGTSRPAPPHRPRPIRAASTATPPPQPPAPTPPAPTTRKPASTVAEQPLQVTEKPAPEAAFALAAADSARRRTAAGADHRSATAGAGARHRTDPGAAAGARAGTETAGRHANRAAIAHGSRPRSRSSQPLPQ